MMFIGNDLIESVTISQENLPKPGYLGSFKRSLKQKYRELILQYPDPPEFLVVDNLNVAAPVAQQQTA
ncbi:MAG: hypothetical protein NVV59_06085 [Chitinophagaceae bacterium]|nr:hypothetical protein [Chitinophagaceae bacterium]